MLLPSLAQASRSASVLAALLLSPAVHAGDVWVDAVNGSNANGGTSSTDAWQTITYALAQLGTTPGIGVDTVHVLPGDYDGALGESYPLELRDRIWLRGEEGPEVTRLHGELRVGIDPDPTGPETGAEGFTIVGARTGIKLGIPTPYPVRQATFRDVVLDSCGVGVEVRARRQKSKGSSLLLEDVQFLSCGPPLDVRSVQKAEFSLTLRGCAMRDCWTMRIDAESNSVLDFVVDRSSIRVEKSLLTGIIIDSSTGGGHARVVFRDSEITAFCLSTTAVRLDAATLIERCTITGHDYGIFLAQPLPLVIRDSILYGNDAADIANPNGYPVIIENTNIDDPLYVGQNGNFALEPMFVDPANLDYGLRFGSPCIDRLAPSRKPDFTGRMRDVDGDLDSFAGGDVGAHELYTLNGPGEATLGEAIELEVHGARAEVAAIQLSRVAPLDGPVVTAFGRRWLQDGTFAQIAQVTTGGELATVVSIVAPDDPVMVGVTVGYQALVTSTVAPAGMAWSSVVGMTLR